MTLRAVLFDAAGTLIELAEPVGDAYARLAVPYGAALPPSRIQEAFVRVFRAAPPMAFPDATGPEAVAARERNWWRSVVRGTFRAADSTVRFRAPGHPEGDGFDAFFDGLWRHYAEPAAWRARPGARAALDRLAAAGLALGVVSNFDGRLPGLLEALELAAPLAVVVRPADAGAAKPDPRIFRFALERLGVAARETCFVGDDPVEDLAAARAAGLQAIDVAEVASLSALCKRLLSETPPPAEERR